MKRLYVIFILIIFHVLSLSSLDVKDLDSVTFIGLSIDDHSTNVKEIEASPQYFNVAYSPFLPAYGVYSIFDFITGKEAIIQIGESQISEEPFNLYLPKEVFSFFASSYDKKVNYISLKIKFIGMNREGEESANINVLNLIVDSDETIKQLRENGVNANYIQLGSFAYKKNAYPVISDLLNYLELRPRFYIMKTIVRTGNSPRVFYRVLVGPYNLDLARELTQKINKSKKISVFIKSGDSIIEEYNRGGFE